MTTIDGRQVIPAADLPRRLAGVDDVLVGATPGRKLAVFPVGELPLPKSAKADIDALKAGQSGGVIAESTWQRLITELPGTAAAIGTGADISPETDSGSHVDPIKPGGQIVPNAGRYVKRTADPDGWEWLSANVLASKASKAEVEAIAGRFVSTVPGGYLEIDQDPEANVAFAVHADGTREFLRTKVGGMTVVMVDSSTAAVDGRIDWHGNYQEWAQGLAGYLENALLVEIDSVGRVGRILWADGSQWPSGTPEPTQFVLVDQTSLPNGAQGENASGGWTCTGLDVISTGKWLGCRLVGNDGRAYEGSSGGQTAPFLCSIVCTSPDMRRILWELPCNTAAFPGIQSIQGVAWDTSDDTIWFADKTNKIIRHITLAGVKLLDEIVVSHTLNGIAYRPDLDAIYTPDEGTSTIRLVSCADGSVLRTQTGIHPQADQLHYEQGRNRLWATVGANGVDGQALVYDADTMALLETHTLKGSQSIEGIWYDPDAKALLTVNDGGFHLSANPPLALACKYNYL
ncbi:YncE family protein [Stenotrophomonas maltophilia]|uniref:YncE family protein n=1 Tax=Stenotrophomonas maltophilia TaxID=40324 RepID=UPI0013DA939F|nr:WD40 repeat domain-containing protein [Stenotrophomonas maltophilia]